MTTTESDWQRLVDTETGLQAQIAAAREQARERVERARAAAASAQPDVAALQTLAAEQEMADRARHQEQLERLARQTQAALRALDELPQERVDSLARWVLDRVFDRDGAAP